MKYYAVKSGRQPGIYESWQECKEQIMGYSGAVFKGFTDREAAADYLQEQPAEQIINEALPLAYIDGSFSSKAGLYSWGGYLQAKGQRYILQGTGNRPEYLKERNIAGEIIGALQVIFTAQRLKIPELNLYFDYAGIEQWAVGNWKAKTPLAQYYKSTFDLLEDDVHVNFVKVEGHTGIQGNEIADYLAKEAAGVQLRKKDIAALQEFREGTT